MSGTLYAQHGRRRGRTGSRSGGVGFDPLLMATLVEWWDADRFDLMSLTGSLVDSIAGVKTGYVLSGATTARPTYSATGLRGTPALVFDGVANALTCTTAGLLAALPATSSPSTILVVCGQETLGTDSTSTIMGGYGNTAATARQLRRKAVSNENRPEIDTGNGTTTDAVQDLDVDFSTSHAVLGTFGAAESNLYTDTEAAVPLASVPATTVSRVRMGAGTSGTAANFFKGPIKIMALFSSVLTATERIRLMAWANTEATASPEGYFVSMDTWVTDGITWLAGDGTPGETWSIARDAKLDMDRYEVRAGDEAPTDAPGPPEYERAEVRYGTPPFVYDTDIWVGFRQRVVFGTILPVADNGPFQCIIGQWHDGNSPGVSPIVSAELTSAGDFIIATRGGDGTKQIRFTDADFESDREYEHAVRVKFSATAGELEWWRDAVKILDLTGIPIGYADDTDNPYFKRGIYRKAATDTLVAYYRDTRVSTTFADLVLSDAMLAAIG